MRDQITRLLYAAGNGDEKMIRRLIDAGLSVNSANHVGGTALMSACACYNVDMVDFLLRSGADVNMRTIDGQTALHAAVGSSPTFPERQKQCVRLLIDSSAPIDAQDESGGTPLMNAAWFGCVFAALELLRAGASPFLKDKQGRTAKDLALLKEQHEILRMLT